ncbi:sensor domain-containing diguanylate cyclase [Pseudohongiella sp.]|uniref:GGDEF domain-containing protein n=1 Tax=marine sediment metagenome TaxID=412755 RepID=A0A0F9WEL5_9ZZZZ|nr:sensor domain-containing diguanylate cyclase [Pseudohongiella sp.]HDZ08317.1 diguanylate cyclase [Pseudohongiella sp.]HEA62593.1 diguanylate cyclase [Pseudohongiella sp.]
MTTLVRDESILWSALFEQSGDAMVALRQDGSVYRANRRYADMLGYTLDEMKTLFVWDWDTHFSKEVLLEMLKTVDNSGAHFVSTQRRKDGTTIDVELSNNGALYRGESLIFCIIRDITARNATAMKLQQSEERLQRIASQVPGALYQYRMAPDGERSFPYFSEGIVELGGLTWAELSGPSIDPVMSHIHREDAALIETTVQRSARHLSHAHIEFRIHHGDGSHRWIESRATPQREEDGSVLWTGILLDITKRVEAEEKVRLLAKTDGLTGINNRQEFNRLLDQEIGRAARYGSPMALIMYDLDHFKRVNDRFGHDTGDDVLRKVAELTNQHIRGTDLHGRWGGEEFMVILPQTGLDAARDVAEKLRKTIAHYAFNKVGAVTASYGVVELNPQENAKALAQRVDEAMYRAKERGRNRVES